MVISNNPTECQINLFDLIFSIKNLEILKMRNTSLIDFLNNGNETHILQDIDLSLNEIIDNDISKHLKVLPKLKIINVEENDAVE